LTSDVLFTKIDLQKQTKIIISFENDFLDDDKMVNINFFFELIN